MTSEGGRSVVTRPRLLDLFCGAGGAAAGYHRAGFYVVGVDITPQANYCGDEFYRADALKVLDTLIVTDGQWIDRWRPRFQLADFTAIHASPPCQAHTGVPFKRKDHPELIGRTRGLLEETGLPWVIENVPGAPLDGILLCGATFGLPIVRHRIFESSFSMMAPSTCRAKSTLRATGHGPSFCAYAHGSWRPRWRAEVLPVVWPWMTLEESGEAVPPAYTEFIGTQLLSHLALTTHDTGGAE
jgi:DNA (cytosine-5)-methyltransferase 1